MQFCKGKLFWKNENNLYCIKNIKWSEDKIDYFSFLKEQRNLQYHQILISSETYISLLKYMIINKSFTLVKIKFMEEDVEYNEEISSILANMNSNPSYLIYLLDVLKPISEKSSIEIKSMYFKKRNSYGEAQQFYIQSNGVVGINCESFNEVSDLICEFVKGCVFP